MIIAAIGNNIEKHLRDLQIELDIDYTIEDIFACFIWRKCYLVVVIDIIFKHFLFVSVSFNS